MLPTNFPGKDRKVGMNLVSQPVKIPHGQVELCKTHTDTCKFVLLSTKPWKPVHTQVHKHENKPMHTRTLHIPKYCWDLTI